MEIADFPVHDQIVTPSSFNLILRNYTSGLAELDISVSHFFCNLLFISLYLREFEKKCEGSFS